MMPLSIATPVPSGPPRNLRWTVAQFHYLGDLGVFEGRRAKLIDGVLIEEGPMNPPHAIAMEKTHEIIRAAFGSGWRFRIQMPLVVGQTTDPVPDFAIIAGTPQGVTTHPTAASLVIEVADSSLSYDTTTKAELYATAGVPEYWVLDLEHNQLIVFRDPAPLPAGLGAIVYRSRQTFGPTDQVSPLAAAGASITVSDLLP